MTKADNTYNIIIMTATAAMKFICIKHFAISDSFFLIKILFIVQVFKCPTEFGKNELFRSK